MFFRCNGYVGYTAEMKNEIIAWILFSILVIVIVWFMYRAIKE